MVAADTSNTCVMLPTIEAATCIIKECKYNVIHTLVFNCSVNIIAIDNTTYIASWSYYQALVGPRCIYVCTVTTCTIRCILNCMHTMYEGVSPTDWNCGSMMPPD